MDQPVTAFHDAPGAVGTWPEVESQRDGAAGLLLDITAEVEAMLSVEAALLAASRVLIKDVGEAEAVKDMGGGKAEQDRPVCRPAEGAVDGQPCHGTTPKIRSS